MSDPLPRLNASRRGRGVRPRILQFGGGNLLRAFIDWKIDLMNEAAGTDWGIVILRSLGGTEGSALNAQGGLFTVVSRGIGADGAPRSDARIVTSVLEEMSCTADWPRALAFARDPGIAVIVSNTTEAGIAHDPASRPEDAPPASFPAKLALMLLERFRALGGGPGSGWQVLPCELTDRNGDRLREIVLAHASEWRAGPGFDAWVSRECVFYNTLVDRIVPGHPGAAEAARIERDLGYADACLATAELYHLLVIERRPGQPAPVLPLDRWDAGTVVVEDATPYKLRKVALLNGMHTALCPLAMIAGVESVGEAMETPALRAMMRRCLDREIKPFVPLPADELDRFGDDVMRRFANPFIRHRWHDISLNGLVKYRDRNLDRLSAFIGRHGAPPPVLTLSLAGWLAFYLGRFEAAHRLPPRDAPGMLAAIGALGRLDDGTEAGRRRLVEGFLSEPAFWGRPILTPALADAVAAAFGALTAGPIDAAGMAAILDRIG